MRAELDVASAPVGAPWSAASPGAARRAGLRRGPDWFELLVLTAFAAISMWVVALDLVQASAHGLVWTGTDGFYIVDQMQYLAWIREAAKHVLISNLFVLRPTPADYFQPAIVISGGLSALGVAPWLSLLLWKPVSVIAVFYGIRAWAYRCLEGVWPRRLALVLGLFFGSLTVIYGSAGVLGDLFPSFLSWGYTFGLLALAVALFSLLVYARAHDERDERAERRAWIAGGLGALSSLLHPWQGEVLILVVVGAELVLWPFPSWSWRRLKLPAIAVILTGAPLLYYEILGRTDLSWKLARDASKHSFSLWTIVLAILPLLLPALIAYRTRPRAFLPAVNRVWPVAGFAIYLFSASGVSATPLHAFEGVTIPLSILAIQGLQRAGFNRLPARRLIATALVLLFTVPAVVLEMLQARSVLAPTVDENSTFIRADEQKALRYLAKDRQPGGVLTRFYLGSVVPEETGRRVYVGQCIWSQPNCNQRSQIAQMLFDGALPSDSARWFVQLIGAKFVLGDCLTRANLTTMLGPLVESVHRFGCASVYTLREPGQPNAALAESPPDAALRASGRQQRRVQHA